MEPVVYKEDQVELEVVAGLVNERLAKEGVDIERARAEVRLPAYHWHELKLVMLIDGETWGYCLLKFQGGVYISDIGPQSGSKRWKLRKTAVDRIARYIKGTIDAKIERRRKMDRRDYLKSLVEGVEGIRSCHPNYWTYVDGTDCQLEIHEDRITLNSRNDRIYLSIQVPFDEFDAVIVDQVREVVRQFLRIKKIRDEAERILKLKIEGIEDEA